MMSLQILNHQPFRIIERAMFEDWLDCACSPKDFQGF